MLDQIIKNKLLEVEILKGEQEHTISDVVKMNLPKNSFVESVRDKIKNGKNAIIAELKRCSPSKGYLDKKLDIKAMASLYEKSGAACISVLTDEKFFKGTKNDLMLAKNTCSLPILRKDFIIDESQVIESKVIGADCILLIIACLSRKKFKSLLDISKSLDLDVLVEVHDEEELDMALDFKCNMIGINNRNLKNFNVSIETSKVLRKKIMDNSIIVISESGIKDLKTIKNLNNSNIHAFLIGEGLITNDNPEFLLKKLVN
ncbi:MAG: indole-3-glycerol phosphate synthase TrpC [Gammaproteobacteria bacterium]|jgi:indole-3-glycerol phosphate synthase|nr:indole-3-glycerol phosphate synthase TrpC [Gammaproteobacteria bacterium]MBT5644697.1 indole-3-glycerol phosphate synthase TrpC [Gammaproteobacteria bacterium]MBT5863302.1 indole-3-glycerol phosphate synthase TrpC [Gammaproteobacteria bacterium]|tara:strand:+ start:2299 stop:3078 length:780 start_codon:yes stop_codon:yes gene_type:complete